VATACDENVGRLDVPVNDSLAVSSIECIGNLDSPIENLFEWKRLASDAMFKGLAFQTLHDYEGLVSLLTDVVNRANVWMIKGGRSASLPAKAFEGLWVLGEVIGKELQSNEAAELRILGFVDNTHSAATELFEDAVVRDGLPDKRVGIRHSAAILGCDLEQVNESEGLFGDFTKVRQLAVFAILLVFAKPSADAKKRFWEKLYGQV